MSVRHSPQVIILASSFDWYYVVHISEDKVSWAVFMIKFSTKPEIIDGKYYSFHSVCVYIKCLWAHNLCKMSELVNQSEYVPMNRY